MRRRLIANFQPEKKVSKKVKQLTEQRKILEVLAASAVKGGSENNILGAQLTRLPLLFCDDDGTPFSRTSKTGIRSWIEKRYPESFLNSQHLLNKESILIRDGMQDLMTAPKSTYANFNDYFDLFWDLKVNHSLRLCSSVAIVFDNQNQQPSPKDQTRNRRDDSRKACPTINVAEQEDLPHRYAWGEFLRNRSNKKGLVGFLCTKLKECSHRMNEGQTLFLSFEEEVWKITKGQIVKRFDLTNNHEEADTRIFFLANSLRYR